MRANIEKEDEVEFVKEHAGEGVGLFRSEYLYLAAPQVPSEESQYHSYKTVAEAFPDHPSGDPHAGLGRRQTDEWRAAFISARGQPVSGVPGDSFCLEHLDIFQIATAAILRVKCAR